MANDSCSCPKMIRFTFISVSASVILFKPAFFSEASEDVSFAAASSYSRSTASEASSRTTEGPRDVL